MQRRLHPHAGRGMLGVHEGVPGGRMEPQAKALLPAPGTKMGGTGTSNTHPCWGPGSRGCHWLPPGLSPSVRVLKSMERASSSASGGRFHSSRVST